MVTNWRNATVLAAATVLLWATPTATSHLLPGAGGPQQPPPKKEPVYEAVCRTVVDGSRVTAHCHNPFPNADRIRLHVECDRWWDLDADTTPVELLPAGYTKLSQRCWKEIRAVWVSHQPVPADAGT
ncbi:hypothetical protein [Streptomyces sp. NPDC005805]|uniref:hypothetical protein n=1 Tax=Streptomyces sp. NPDC005805 TaxID=3157068 RepID=UPI0033EB34BE